MKIKPEAIERLAGMLLNRYCEKELIAKKAEDGKIKAKIAAIVTANFQEEEAIEEEARKMLAAHARGAKDMDPFKMFLIAKQKLAARKGFIL